MANAASLLFGLLGSPGEGAPWVPPQPSGPPPGENALIPPAASPLMESLRPPVAQVLRVGADKPFKRISDALAQAARMQAASADTPWMGIAVDPGVYAEEPGRMGLRKVALFSSTGEPRSVTVMAGFDYAQAPFYVEGFILDARGTAEPKYGIHAGVVDASAVMVGSELYSSLHPVGSGWPVGTDGGNGGYLLFYDVIMHGGRTNNHGSAGQIQPFKQVYVNVVADGGLEYNGLGNTQPDELWVIESQASWAGLGDSPNGVFYATESRPSVGSGRYGLRAPVTVEADSWPRPVWEA